MTVLVCLAIDRNGSFTPPQRLHIDWSNHTRRYLHYAWFIHRIRPMFRFLFSVSIKKRKNIKQWTWMFSIEWWRIIISKVYALWTHLKQIYLLINFELFSLDTLVVVCLLLGSSTSSPSHQRRIRDAKPENVVGVATNIVASTILQVCIRQQLLPHYPIHVKMLQLHTINRLP